MSCDICSRLKEKGFVLEDDNIAAFFSPQPAAAGHVILTTKGHFPIIENISDELISHIGVVSNRISKAIFESLGAAGTNILINNGTPAGQSEPHFTVHIVPRQDGDKIGLAWSPEKASEDVLKEIEEKIVSALHKKPEKSEQPSEDYILKSLTRIP